MWTFYYGKDILPCEYPNHDFRGVFVVYADGMNYALFRPASQSSTHRDFVAGKAVDGDVNNFSSISHTLDGDYHPWWKVELAHPIPVTHVEITNTQRLGKKNIEHTFFIL